MDVLEKASAFDSVYGDGPDGPIQNGDGVDGVMNVSTSSSRENYESVFHERTGWPP